MVLGLSVPGVFVFSTAASSTAAAVAKTVTAPEQQYFRSSLVGGVSHGIKKAVLLTAVRVLAACRSAFRCWHGGECAVLDKQNITFMF